MRFRTPMMRPFDAACVDLNHSEGKEKMPRFSLAVPSHPRAARRTARRAPVRALPLALAIALGGTTLVAAPACSITPALIDAAITVCRAVIMQVLERPLDVLPDGYEPCGSDSWTVRGRTVQFCFYCKPDHSAPPIVQLDCEGPYYPFKRPLSAAPDGPNESFEPLSPSSPDARGLSIEKIDCAERLVTLAEARCDAALSVARVAVVAPNERVLPDLAHYPLLEVTIDGAAPVGSTAPRGSAIAFHGPFDQVAHFAATLGVQEFAFRADGAHWTVVLNPEHAAAAVFRNGAFHEVRFVFATEESFADTP